MDNAPTLDINSVITSTLNESQSHAVKHIDGALLVLAGAGTGKTKVLTHRIANLISHGVFPGQILAVTFTNKAAKEMLSRISTLSPHHSQGLWLGTFHSIAARILRMHAEMVGLSSDYTIIDADDQLRLIKQIYNELNIDEKRYPAKTMVHVISRWKDSGLLPHQVSHHEASDFAGGKALEIYEIYQSRLKNLNAADFGDLLLYNIQLFNENPEILEDYHRRFKYILVDEYQDTNVAQYLWLRLLAQKHKNLCCVGDDDQSIYGWRGAEVGNILRFEKDFPGAEVVRLEHNYRSTSNILKAASHLISFNSSRLGKTLYAAQETTGEKITLVSLWDDREEAQYVAERIYDIKTNQSHTNWDDFAILVRASFQTRSFEEAFIAHNIPYKIIGGLRFYERMEIRDTIAYLRLVQQKHDGLALERAINTPKRGIGPSTLQLIRNTANERGISYTAGIESLLNEGRFTPKITATLQGFLQNLAEWQRDKEQLTVAQLAEKVLNDSGYLGMWKQEKTIESQSRLDNLKELIHALEEFESLQEFLEYISLVNDVDEQNQEKMVSIMTLHAAKGLEFDTVFLPGWEDGLFPSQRTIGESGTKGLEEERRLAYVGITRAKRRLFITYTANRRMYGQFHNNLPSRFLDELPDEVLTKESRMNPFFGSQETYPRPSQFAERKKEISNVPQAKSAAGFAVGDKVSHIKFGQGTVTGISGNQLEITFSTIGKKKIVDSFVKKA